MTVEAILSILEKTTGCYYRISYSKKGKRAWVWEYNGEKDLGKQISPKIYKSKLHEWLWNYYEMKRSQS